ncbi:MAG: hypothetical protein ACD_44C00066G0006 [uncultured bacterium]|nr:MAG: hypothetical protein ACD_44C00066G0006 [uncultured bacterium]OGT16817.1 MAG: hypothetical protein A3B69_04090 [Gammaproteobacteria bacterium RIFCSPHIGHO2_02_FULL_38_33]OGT24779.1 MAG: hypothetical protein A2W47_01965 [Gammaproteobacteria bacterium RIFCSPHIGHO2_12_38_15]OGT67470.1 MAG: hypothetical protein A3I12_04240 [Gammaproteobacteria bacterium RIFCSPLOWO2_02_FULL_38_11]OGT76176.1 MAG: hypothetical protein A3G71_04630 [Gammaproteobacteria bacterium RIFCSPLOWO2_12_FULL_38_14]
MKGDISEMRLRLSQLLKFVFDKFSPEFQEKFNLKLLISPAKLNFEKPSFKGEELLEEIERVVIKLNSLNLSDVELYRKEYSGCMPDFFKLVYAFSYVQDELLPLLYRWGMEENIFKPQVNLKDPKSFLEIIRALRSNHPSHGLEHWRKGFELAFKECYPGSNPLVLTQFFDFFKHHREFKVNPILNRADLAIQTLKTYAERRASNGFGFFRKHIPEAWSLIERLERNELSVAELLLEKESILKKVAAREQGGFRAAFDEIEKQYKILLTTEFEPAASSAMAKRD